MRSILRSVVASTLLAGQLGAAQAQEAPLAVVELFTSQGCSSCPPADKVLGELATRHDVVALTFPVDYWDYLGWRDTLGSAANSRRQRDYAENRGDRAVYTPQVVVNGDAHVVGSDRAALSRALSASAPFPARVTMTRQGELVEIAIDGTLPAGMKAASVSLLAIAPPVSVDIARGENRGRRITYTNVVQDMHAVGMWEGGKVVFRLPVSEMRKTKASGCAILVQEENRGRPGRILGAALL
jgi:hypothetical protein